MKRVIGIAVAVALMLGVISCATIEKWDIGRFVGSIYVYADSSNTTPIEGNIMAVFYTLEDDRAILSYGEGHTIIDRGDGYWNVYDSQGRKVAEGINQSLVDYGLFRYKQLPDLASGNYYMDDLDLEEITWEDLPQSTHVAALKSVYMVDGSPRADVYRMYMSVVYTVTGCRAAQSAYDAYVAGKLKVYDVAYDWLAPENKDCFVAVDFIHENFTGTDMVLPFIADKLIK
jgi:hypothetical protein